VFVAESLYALVIDLKAVAGIERFGTLTGHCLRIVGHFPEQMLEPAGGDDLEDPARHVASVPEGVPLGARFEDEVPLFRVDDLIAKLRSHASLEDVAVLVLVRMTVERSDERPRGDRMLNEGESSPGLLAPDHKPNARHGVVDLGVRVRLAFFKPAHGLTPELVARYEANRLTLTRQLPYEFGTNKTVDLAFFVNGVPVATAELKNALTGQGVEDAKEQYRTKRDPKNVTLGRRAVVHFAVDTEQVAMTTWLAGTSTRFLPFNRGYNRGKGNPPNPHGHRTAYLWERVWEKDAWLDLLGQFVHVEKPAKGLKAPGTMIFPRYHQWDAVLELSTHAREHGAGESYLVQHSAGSGKSNTIAWLAHRLSSLHDAADEKVFDKVVVITDRVVLDKQLQETIYQFEHAHGVVQKIDESSAQLAEALSGQTARIIITTLQKFPFVLDKIEELPARNYAVIIDEAHSSQTG
jgi:type I restriction enzyme, R subunit